MPPPRPRRDHDAAAQRNEDAIVIVREREGEKGGGDGDDGRGASGLAVTGSSSSTWNSLRAIRRRLTSLPTIAKVATHASVAVAWVFLATFGAVMEAQQLEDNALACVDVDEGERAPSSYPHAYSSSCAARLPYQPAYRVLHLVGASLGLMQLSAGAALAAYRLLLLLHGAAFLLRDHLQLLVWVPTTSATLYTYQHLTYNVLFCGYADGAFCRHKSDEYPTLRGVYMSLLVVGAVTTATHAVTIGAFAWTFATRRLEAWRRIVDTESALMATPHLREAFATRRALRRTTNVRDFVARWGHCSDDDILEELPRRSRRVASALIDAIRGNNDDKETRSDNDDGAANEATAEGAAADEKRDEQEQRQQRPLLTRLEFEAYARRQGVSAAEASRAWSVLADRSKDPTDPLSFSSASPSCPSCDDDKTTKDAIDRDDIEDLLYELFFDRKQLANALRTDERVMAYVMRYAIATLYPACFIVIAKIFGYADSFGRGVDLFKTYAVIVSYIYSSILTHVNFVVLMLAERPFDIGDVLGGGVGGTSPDDVYEVRSFTSSHTALSGSTALVVSNASFVDNAIVNLTRESVSQSADLSLPLHATYGVEDMAAAMRAYMAAHPRDVRPDSVRVGWIAVGDGTKTLRCNWRYRFRAFDRSRIKAARTRVLNALLGDGTPELARAALVGGVAGGGGLNDMSAVAQHARDEWNDFEELERRCREEAAAVAAADSKKRR